MTPFQSGSTRSHSRLIFLLSLFFFLSNCEDQTETGIPEAPSAPVVKAGDGELHIAWEAVSAAVKVDDLYGDIPKTHRAFDGQYQYKILSGDSYPDMASLHIYKSEDGSNAYSLSVSPPKSADVHHSGPMKWTGPIPKMPLGDFMPLTITGEYTDCPWDDGVSTKIEWQFERHIKYL